MKHYYLVHAIQKFHMLYAVPVDEVKNLEEAKSLVDLKAVQEFSQTDAGETITEVETLSEEQLLERFDQELDYLKSWSKEQKISFINNWRESLS